jgi:nucleotide-binding universal stress UspA family protein
MGPKYKTMKTILVLTDFSIRAEHAAHYALKIAQKIKVNLLLCNIFPELYEEPKFALSTRPAAKYESFKDESVEGLNELAGRLNKVLDNKTTDDEFRPVIGTCCKAGPVEEVIDEITLNHTILMAVISMHSPDVSGSFLLEDHAREIIEKANCPVLVVPYHAVFNGFKKISFATDMSHSGLDVLNCLYGLTKYFDSEILVTHVAENALEMEEHPNIKQLLDQGYSSINRPKIYYRAVKSKSVTAGLDWLSEYTDIDLLVLVHRKRNFFQKIFDESVTQKLAESVTKPMLVFSGKKVQEPLPVF